MAGAASSFRVVELYAPGHFGNSYEAMGEQEMRHVLAPRYMPLPWYRDWAKHAAETAQTLDDDA